MKRKYFFDHVMKTAGTALHAAFSSILGSQNVAVTASSYRQACSDYESYRMISGHVSFFPGDRLSPDRYHITLLRDPVERALSHFFFLKSDLHREGIGLAKWTNIRDFVFSNDGSALAIISNYQTLHYMSLEWDGKSNPSEIEQIELAKKALDRYDLVGTYEYLNDFVDVFCYECALPPAMQIPRINVTSKRLRDSRVNQDVIERLSELNTVDMELYRYAANRFLARKRKMMVKCIIDRAEDVYVPSADESMWEASPDSESSEAIRSDIEGPDQGAIASRMEPADFGTKELEILYVEIWGDISKSPILLSAETANVRIAFRAHQVMDHFAVGMAIRDNHNRLMYATHTEALMQRLAISSCGEFYVDFRFRNNLGPGEYSATISLHKGNPDRDLCCHFRECAARFEVNGNTAFAFAGTTQLYPTVSYGTIDGIPDSIQASPVIEGFPSALRYLLDPPALTEFSATMKVVSVIGQVSPSELIGIEIEITNTGSQTWYSTGLRPVLLSYHWSDEKREMLLLDGLRTDLPRDIRPNETFRLLATVRTLDHEGKALLQFSLMQEFVAWFDEQGVPPAEVWIEIGDTESSRFETKR